MVCNYRDLIDITLQAIRLKILQSSAKRTQLQPLPDMPQLPNSYASTTSVSYFGRITDLGNFKVVNYRALPGPAPRSWYNSCYRDPGTRCIHRQRNMVPKAKRDSATGAASADFQGRVYVTQICRLELLMN